VRQRACGWGVHATRRVGACADCIHFRGRHRGLFGTIRILAYDQEVRRAVACATSAVVPASQARLGQFLFGEPGRPNSILDWSCWPFRCGNAADKQFLLLHNTDSCGLHTTCRALLSRACGNARIISFRPDSARAICHRSARSGARHPRDDRIYWCLSLLRGPHPTIVCRSLSAESTDGRRLLHCVPHTPAACRPLRLRGRFDGSRGICHVPVSCGTQFPPLPRLCRQAVSGDLALGLAQRCCGSARGDYSANAYIFIIVFDVCHTCSWQATMRVARDCSASMVDIERARTGSARRSQATTSARILPRMGPRFTQPTRPAKPGCPPPLALSATGGLRARPDGAPDVGRAPDGSSNEKFSRPTRRFRNGDAGGGLYASVCHYTHIYR